MDTKVRTPTLSEKRAASKAFKRAQRTARNRDGVVCATVAEDEVGTPLYFVMPKDATNEEVQARAFEVRTGRPANKRDKLFFSMLEQVSEADVE